MLSCKNSNVFKIAVAVVGRVSIAVGGGVVGCSGLEALQILLQVVRGFIIYSTGYRERRNSLFLHMQGFQVSSTPSTLSQVISFLVRKSVPRTSGAVHMFLNECLAGKGNLDSSFFIGFC